SRRSARASPTRAHTIPPADDPGGLDHPRIAALQPTHCEHQLASLRLSPKPRDHAHLSQRTKVPESVDEHPQYPAHRHNKYARARTRHARVNSTTHDEATGAHTACDFASGQRPDTPHAPSHPS